MDIIKNGDVLKNLDTTRIELCDKFKVFTSVAVDAAKEFVTNKIMVKVFKKDPKAPENIILKVTAAAAAVWTWTRDISKGIAYTVTHPQWQEFCAVGVFAAAVVGAIASFFSETVKKLRWVFGLLGAAAAAIVIIRAILRPRD